MNDQASLFPADPGHDPGGKRLLPLAPGVTGRAVFGGAREEYRYQLARIWEPARPGVMLLMMNPSTANPLLDDPTVAKVTRMAMRWHDRRYGYLLVGNTFAYRCTDQARLTEVADPIGPENDAWLLRMADEAALIVCAYGKPKVAALRQRGPAAAAMLRAAGHQLHVLKLGAEDTPYHPLYLPDATAPQPWPEH